MNYSQPEDGIYLCVIEQKRFEGMRLYSIIKVSYFAILQGEDLVSKPSYEVA